MNKSEAVIGRESLPSLDRRRSLGTQRSALSTALGRLLNARLSWFGLLVLLGMIFLAATADFLTPYDPSYQDYASLLQPPSALH